MIRFFHHAVPSAFSNGTTLGYQRIEGDKYLVTFARCSDKDVFDKKKARLICEGRMRKGVKVLEVVKPEGADKYEFFKELISQNDDKAIASYGTRKETV